MILSASNAWPVETTPGVMPCQATPEALIYERAMCDRVPLDEVPSPDEKAGTAAPMASKSGRLLLLGDAAHAMHPSAGQVCVSPAEPMVELRRA
jgi:hypothetical protein